MVMFSGLVCVGILEACGRSTFLKLVITGMVIKKMISSTSITSTRGVVLMVAITAGSPPFPGPTLIAMDDYPCLLLRALTCAETLPVLPPDARHQARSW